MKQLQIETKDRIGLIADISEVLGKRGINIESLVLERFKSTAVIHLLTKDEQSASDALEKIGLKPKISDIMVLRVEDRPGELSKLTRRLARADVNIESIYMLNKEGAEGIFAVKVDKLDEAKKVLEK